MKIIKIFIAFFLFFNNLLSQNLVVNGDFSAGNTGFFTNYTYCNTGNCLFSYVNEAYSIGPNPNFFHSVFVGKDHTTGTGNMMIFNGGIPSYSAWTQTISVLPANTYSFSIWACSVYTNNIAQLNFSINGVSIGTLTPSNTYNTWTQFSTTWNSNASNTAVIRVNSLNTTGSNAGVDFGLDDIDFRIQTYTIPPCVGILTGTGMNICNQYSFSITPSQTITPFNYSNQSYVCTGATMPDVSFNILGAGWRVMKNNWNFQSSVAGELRGYTSSGALQTLTFSPTNTITPLSYSGSLVQFAINGVATGSLVNQSTFSISLTSSLHSPSNYTYCPSSSPSIAISPTIPNQGGPWTYSWQPGGLTGNPINVNPQINTVYTVTATSGVGCISSTSVSVNINCPQAPLCSGNLGNPVFLEDFGSGAALYGPPLPPGVTNYSYQTGNPPNGTYVISRSSNPSGVNLGYVNDGDHTGNPNGYMMVVNSDYPASEVYRKHVTGLCENTTYVFSSYLSNNNTPTTPNTVCPGYVYANVKFQIEYPLGTIQNSVTTGNLPLGLSNTALNWQQYGFAFTTLPGQTSVDIVLKNNAPGGCGNDYVVDDISLSPCGPGVALSIVPNQTVFCVGDAISLQSNYTFGSYVNPQYQWQFSNNGGSTWNNIPGATSQNYSIPSASASQGGIYQLLVAENGNINISSCSIIAGPISFSIDPTCNTNVTYFSAPDTVCVNQQFNVIDQSIGATTYYWNFCQGNTSTVPQGINLGNIGAFNGPVFMSIAKDGTDYYAFVCNNSVSTITRLFFGSSLMNTPVATNLGNVGGVLPGNLEDIHLELENGNWFGIVTGGMSGGERIVRLNFGSTLANIPTATNFGNLGGLSYPQRIKIFQSGGSYYGFIVNRDNNTITRISFGSSLSNTPTGINLGNIGALNIPDALGMINFNNSWYGYVINEGNNTISRLDFGASLLNIPTGTNLGNTGALNGPRAIDMWTECGQIKGLITNRYSNDILDMNFSAGPTGPVSTVSYGNIAGFSFPHSITRFRSGDTLYAFITNVNNNSLSRVFFANCTNSSIASSNLPSPPPVSYNSPGIYYISQVVNEGQITQASYCKQITVIASPTLAVLSSSVCSGQTTTVSVTGASTYSWSNGAITNSITVAPSTTTIYTVTGSVGSCTSQAVTTVSVVPSLSISVSGNTVICPGQSTTLTANGASGYIWNSGTTSSSLIVSPNVTSSYSVSATGSVCVNTSVITVSVLATPTISVSSNTSICSGINASATLTVSGADSFVWANSQTLSSSTATVVVASPSTTTIYTVTGTTSICSNTAAVTVSVNPSPIINTTLINNTFCGLNNGSATITSTPSNNTYSWNSGVLSTTNTAGSLAAGNYTVTAINGICQTSTVVTILSSTPLLITSSTVIPSDCNVNNGSIVVTDNFSNSNYSWTPNVTSTNSAINLVPGTYSLTIINGACNTSTFFTVTQLNGPTALNINQSSAICQSSNGSISIINVVNGQGPYQYNFNNYGFSSITTYSNLTVGSYSIIVKDANSCLYTQTLTIGQVTINAVLDLITNAPNCLSQDGKFVINNISGGTAPYLTEFNQTGLTSNLIFDNLSSGNYTLSVVDSNRCETNFILTMPPNDGDYTLYIPNTFTPNHDSVNDVWYIQGTCLGAIKCLIYNRWGEKIYEITDIENGWNGTYKGVGVPDGVYVYVLEVETTTGIIDKAGHITLFR